MVIVRGYTTGARRLSCSTARWRDPGPALARWRDPAFRFLSVSWAGGGGQKSNNAKVVESLTAGEKRGQINTAKGREIRLYRVCVDFPEVGVGRPVGKCRCRQRLRARNGTNASRCARRVQESSKSARLSAGRCVLHRRDVVWSSSEMPVHTASKCRWLAYAVAEENGSTH